MGRFFMDTYSIYPKCVFFLFPLVFCVSEMNFWSLISQVNYKLIKLPEQLNFC